MGLKPSYRITANSQDITDAIADRFVSLAITDEAGLQADTLQLTLTDHLDTAPLELPPAGAELEAWLGYDGEAARMGLFIVDELELSGPPDQLVIRAKAAPMEDSASGAGSTRAPLQTQKTRSWAPQTLGALVQSIASEHGLQPAVASSLASIQLPHVDQVAESDMNLLTRLASNYDAIAKPAGGHLILAKRGESKTVSGQDLPTVTLTPGDLTSWRMTVAKRDQAKTVIATWRDVAAAADVEVTVGTGEPIKRLYHQYTDAATARAASEAELARSARGERNLSLELPGRTDMVAECRLVTQEFVRDGYNGEWLVTRVQHTLDAGGYRCSVDAEVPPVE